MRDQSGLVVVENDQATGGGLQLLDQSTVIGARWVDVQGCCGVHDSASLCGEEKRQYQPMIDICQQPAVDIFSSSLGFCEFMVAKWCLGKVELNLWKNKDVAVEDTDLDRYRY
ncbi:hypothetical protein [Pseudomonas helleri]|uniref:hypothetical protein n=1 Tax=Pseudomonas helleri TaxID=1608996 RepID=UPI003D0E58EB